MRPNTLAYKLQDLKGPYLLYINLFIYILFQGCMASTEFSKESMDPLRTAVIPSSTVKHGCQGILVKHSTNSQ